jgi:hypothetical protein
VLRVFWRLVLEDQSRFGSFPVNCTDSAKGKTQGIARTDICEPITILIMIDQPSPHISGLTNVNQSVKSHFVRLCIVCAFVNAIDSGLGRNAALVDVPPVAIESD